MAAQKVGHKCRKICETLFCITIIIDSQQQVYWGDNTHFNSENDYLKIKLSGASLNKSNLIMIITFSALQPEPQIISLTWEFQPEIWAGYLEVMVCRCSSSAWWRNKL